MLAELWHYRGLLFFLVWRDVKIRYKQTVLGATWAIIQPFMTMIVFTLLFGELAGLPNEGVPYPVFYYSALVPWTFFATGLSNAGNSLIMNTALVTKVYFPRLYLPGAAVTAGLVDFAIASAMLLGIMAYYGMPFSLELLLWPLLVVPLYLAALGVGLVLAALNVNYRDVKYTIPFLVQLWLFLSPVIYPASMIPERLRFLAALNPVGGVIEAFRATVVPGGRIDFAALGVSMGVTAVLLLLGVAYFRRTERTFADVI